MNVCSIGAACLIFLAAAPLTAQTDSTTDRPFVRGGAYDKPFLAHLGGNTAIGGYAEAHARWEEAGGIREAAGFEAKRFNLLHYLGFLGRRQGGAGNFRDRSSELLSARRE